MQIDLSGRCAIVTGGSKGIGKAIAARLAAAGARVAICARGEEALEATAAELRSRGADAFAMPADARDADDIGRFVDATVARFGRLDILVNNAVTSVQNTFGGLSDDDWRLHIDVKLMGYVRFCRAAMPHLVASGQGRVVNVVGMSARIVTDFRMTNGAVNAAVTNFTKHLAEQVGKDRVTVNAIHPGLTWTPRLEQGLQRWADLEGGTPEEQRAIREAEIPIGRFIQPDDIAALAAFLCSDFASAVTGQAIAVDGGSGRAISY